MFVGSALLAALLLLSTAVDDSPSRIVHSIIRITYVGINTETQAPETHVCAGFVISASKGEALSAAHCVPETEFFVNGQLGEALKRSELFVLVRIPPMTIPPLELQEKTPHVGDVVLAYGYGYGEMQVFHRYVASLNAEGDVLLDGPLAPGMSGGPVVDTQGKVVGLIQGTTPALGVSCGAGELRAFLASKTHQPHP